MKTSQNSFLRRVNELVMDWRERQIMEWLEEVSDEEQVGGS